MAILRLYLDFQAVLSSLFCMSCADGLLAVSITAISCFNCSNLILWSIFDNAIIFFALFVLLYIPCHAI